MARGQLRAAAAVPALLLCGCGKFGTVDQGRVIAYDRQHGKVTVIRDSNRDPARKPAYDVLPPVTVLTPADASEMGPAPESGKLLRIDTENRRIVYFEEGSQALRTIEYRVVDERRGFPNAVAPTVDRERRTITLWVRERRALVTIAATDELLTLPVETWRAGDEVRYYYKQPGQALRFMNITKTDVSKSGG